MANLIKQASDQLREILLGSMGRLVASGAVPPEPVSDFKIEIPADKSHGDFATNAAMVCAKPFRMAPRAIAEKILGELVLEGTYFDRAEIAGPGFINFFLSPRWFAQVVNTVLEETGTYGRTDTGEGKRVLVEFVSANPTGPMHVGNARGGAIGDCLASLLDWAGYQVEREFYINDAGNQIEKFATSLEVRYLQLYRDGVELPEDAYQGMDIVEHAKAFAAENGDRYVDADAKTRRDALVAYALPKNIEGLKRDLGKYRIQYDTWFRESTLHADGSVMEIVRKLRDSGYTYEQDGATWFKATEFGADKDFVLVRSNGIPTYVVPDIAYHYNKLVTRGFDKAIDVLGADHHGYVPRLKAALTALGVDASKLDVVLMQMVFVMRNGQVAKLSKRSGKAITLVTLLEEIPIDAARFFFNLREANSHFEFDLDLAVEKSSQNPVYYVQYAHARICSLLRNLAEEGIQPTELTGELMQQFTQPQEIELIRYIAMLPQEIDTAAKHYDPSRITKYTVELATLFHKFYDACTVKNAEPQLRAARLALCAATRQALANALTMLKITCPEKM
ncbi:arginine--tRNA ligase [Ruminococcus champanellensis]|uniref:Arginine--tRNA ligase n=1 Tax=Ruminococcus champanellensis (strain DSM 18848 / JCM 17042 / KCTC 15320 / 18P13) TaxID=213810 RepID=D4LC01_RUMC1|nr:arginine--tRNA ligase [Ruminococcus champanellensis]CBL17146.1 arginyl-tRNA synthetase [Ruminococcus champanellensis 18P13 = JCM 17042]